MIDISSFFYVAVFLIGLVFGSFFNVLIHRIPVVINSKKKIDTIIKLNWIYKLLFPPLKITISVMINKKIY